MKREILAFIFTGLSFFSYTVVAETVEITSLGKLQLSYKPVVAVTNIAGKKLVASVTNKIGESYVLNTPTNVQQILYLVENGRYVKKGQIIATMKGPEVHHFLSEFQAYQSLYQLTKLRLENSRELFSEKIIDEDKWLQINKNYQSTFLVYEHMRHFYDLITNISEIDDSLQVVSPVDGIIIMPKHMTRISEGDTIASFISKKSIQLEVNIPVNKSEKLSKVSTSRCELAITNKSQIAYGAFSKVWSEPITEICGLSYGQKILVTPHFEQRAYKISKSAVFNYRGRDSIMIKRGLSLITFEVSLLTSDGENYLVSTTSDIGQDQVLVTSVSAVQGVLIGLGGE